MSQRTRAAALLTALLSLVSSAAAFDRVEGYRAVAPLELHSTDGLQRLELPLAVLQASRSEGYADVRLFDAQGAPVPWAWAQRPPRIEGAQRHVSVPLFAWPGAGPTAKNHPVQIDAFGAVVHIDSTPPPTTPLRTLWLLDLSRLDRPAERITRLDLDWRAPAGGIATTVHIEGSDDTRHWTAITHAPLLDLARSGAPALKQVEWPTVQGTQPGVPRYLRLTFDTALVLSRADVLLSQAPAEPPRVSQRVSFTAAQTPPGEPRPWAIDLQGGVPVARLRVHLPQTNTVVPLKLQQRDDVRRPWRTVTSLVAWRLTREGQEIHAPPVTFEASPARFWQLVPDARSAGWSPQTLEVTLEWTAPQLVFAARGLALSETAASAPASLALRLAVGREGHHPAPLTLAALIPGYEAGAEHTLPMATLGPLTAQHVPPPALAENLHDTRHADSQRWTLWCALVLAVVGLAWMAWKLAREVAAVR